MKTISFTEFNRNMKAIIARVQAGEVILLTYRGKPALRLVPLRTSTQKASAEGDQDASLLSLTELWKKWDRSGPSNQLTNEEIDKIVYGL